jgi:hypothetical protein
MGKGIDIPDLPDFIRRILAKKEIVSEGIPPFEFTCPLEGHKIGYKWDGKGTVSWDKGYGRQVEGYNVSEVRKLLDSGDWVKINEEFDPTKPCRFQTLKNGPIFCWDGKNIIYMENYPQEQRNESWTPGRFEAAFKKEGWVKV